MEDLFLSLENLDNPALIFKCVAGSRAYGTNDEHSDVDTRGVFVRRAADYLSVGEPAEHCSNPTNDIVYCSLRRFVALAAKANPNILELFYSPPDCVLKTTPWFEALRVHRAKFITKKIVETHANYAWSQMKKAAVKNARVLEPQPKTPPSVLDFCYFVAADFRGGARPRPLKDCGLDISRLACSQMEHSQGVYRLYRAGKSGGGIFSGAQIRCEAIPLEDEKNFLGLMLFSRDAYKCALAKHSQYWLWINSRNESRWASSGEGDGGYDAKNMSHLFRILISAKNILENGEPLVRFSGEKLSFLMDVKSAKYSYDNLIKTAEGMVKELKSLAETSGLPDCADPAFCGGLVAQITADWENFHNEK